MRREENINSAPGIAPNMTKDRGKQVSKNRMIAADRAFHDWYRFVLSYPPHLVREYLEKFNADPRKHVVLDPFCGTGTTLVEAQKLGFEVAGVEGNPMAHLASRVKTNWGVETEKVEAALRRTLGEARTKLAALGVPEYGDLPLLSNGDGHYEESLDPHGGLSEDEWKLIPAGFISPAPLAKVVALREVIVRMRTVEVRELLMLALAATIVDTAGNVGFGPEVYRKKAKQDAPVLEYFEKKARIMISDLEDVAESGGRVPPAHVMLGDARALERTSKLADILITSPPYPNEKDYTRTTRLESVLLGLVKTKAQLRATKEGLLRSNTRNVYKADDDDVVARNFPSIVRVSEEVERRRLELGKTSGWERLYHRVVLLYFGGMHRHLVSLRSVLRPGALCAYVVGDQMSYFMIHIKTGELLAEVAEHAGYEVTGIDLWRTRFSTASKVDLREEVLLLRRR